MAALFCRSTGCKTRVDAACRAVRFPRGASAAAAAAATPAPASRPSGPPRGTHDYIGPPAALRRSVAAACATTAEAYRFVEAVTPIFEHTHVFERSLGPGSDVVQKEMYTFMDKSANSVTLRPEGTAGVVRALVSGGHCDNHRAHRLYYCGPMFRYERPQAGRMRQFTQFGVEMFGEAGASADVEVMELGARALAAACGVLGLDASGFELHVNSLGGRESQAAYRGVLEEYLRGSEGVLSDESRERLRRGAVLRVLDSKDAADQKTIEGAPNLGASLSTADRERFEAVLEGAVAVGLRVVRNPRLVRGLDYYTQTAFEFVARGASGGQLGTVLAGGRYDGLVAAMGGKDLAGVGWAAGVDRLIALATASGGLTSSAAPEAPFVMVIPVAMGTAAGAGVDAACLRVAKLLRDNGTCVHSVYGARALRKQMQTANSHSASVVVLVGPSEVAAGVAQVKNMATGVQVAVPLFDGPALAAACVTHWKE